MHGFTFSLKTFFASMFLLTIVFCSTSLLAQQQDNYAAERERAIVLINEKNIPKPSRFWKN